MKLVLIAGPGGAGKTSIAEQLDSLPGFVKVVSWTTRPRRSGETESSYTFCSEDDFSAHYDKGGFLETDMLDGFFYGTPKTDLGDRFGVCVVTLDGAASLSMLSDRVCRVFVDVPSEEAQRERLADRGDTAASIAGKILSSKYERARADAEGWRKVVNSDLEETVALIADIVGSEHVLGRD